MTVCLHGVSALEFWRTSGIRPSSLPHADATSLPVFESSGPALDSLPGVHAQFRTPIHLMVGRRSLLHVSSAVVAHLCTTPLPSHALLRVNQDVVVCAPELCFLQLLQNGMPRHERILLGYEMCGCYAPPFEEGGELVGRRWGLMSIDSARSFLASLPRVRGVGEAERALRFVLSGSRSPQESLGGMMLCLPRRLGGIALPDACLNYRVDYDEQARRMAGRSFALCDLYWPQVRLDVEYDGLRYHEGREHMLSDRARSNALSHMGVTVLSMYDDQIRSDDAMLDLARDIAAHLGVRLRGFSERDVARRLELRRALLERPGSAKAIWPGLRLDRPVLA